MSRRDAARQGWTPEAAGGVQGVHVHPHPEEKSVCGKSSACNIKGFDPFDPSCVDPQGCTCTPLSTPSAARSQGAAVEGGGRPRGDAARPYTARVIDLARTVPDGLLVVRVECSCGDAHRLVTEQRADEVESVLDLLALIAPCSPEPLEVLDPAGWLEAAADLRRRLRWQATTKGATP